MNPSYVSNALRHIASKIDVSANPSLRLARHDLNRVIHNMRVAANGPVSLTIDGEISINGIDVKYEFFSMEKEVTEDTLKFGVRFILGSDLEERLAMGTIDSSMSKLQISRYVYRNADLHDTGMPGYIKGDSELNRFGLLPNILTKCLKDVMAKVGLSSLRGINVTDNVFHP